jgi:hypothetical protein
MKGGTRMTNYELIKNMSIEEMAEVIGMLETFDDYCKGYCKGDGDIPDGECAKCAEKWLKEEAE